MPAREGRNWMITVNNVDDMPWLLPALNNALVVDVPRLDETTFPMHAHFVHDHEHVLDGCLISAFAGQYERGEETEHLHAHFVIHLEKKRLFTRMQAWFPGAHIEPVRDLAQSVEYVTKSDTRVHGPWKAGVMPINRANAKDWDRIWEQAKAGKVEEIPADVCSDDSLYESVVG